MGSSSTAFALPTVSSQDLGTLAVNTATPATATLTFQISGASWTPSFRLRYGTDFRLGEPGCTSTTCTVTVSFHPTYPGVRQDAVLVVDSNENLLATTFLHGIGLAPEAVLLPGTITTLAGTREWGNSGDGGLAVNATLMNPQGVAVDTVGNVYIADSVAQVIRKVDALTGIITTVATGLNAPTGVAVDGAGNLYIADSQNNRVRRVDAASGVITTVAGTGTVSSSLGDGSPATQASLNNPADVAVDPVGNLYIADQYHGRIRRVDAVSGIITTVAGGGVPGRGADGIGNGGPATNAVLSNPSSVALDSWGSLYIADSANNLVRKVSNGTISVVAGDGNPGYSGDGEIATGASLNNPTSIRLDAAGNLYIADSSNGLIRQVNGAGIIFTLAGQVGQFGFNANNVPPGKAQLNNPGGVGIDPSGSIYIADQGNSMVRKIVPGPPALNFGSTSIGSISSPQAVSIGNIGNQALDFSSFSLTGNFLQQSSQEADCTPDLTVAPAAFCSASVVFAPQSSGSLNGGFSFTTNSVNAVNGSLKSVALNGTGIGTAGSDPTVNKASLLFASQMAGTSSPSQIVTLFNYGSAPVSVTVSQISGSNANDFSIASNGCKGLVLAAQASCTVSVVFTPQGAGVRSGTLLLVEKLNGAPGTTFQQSIFLAGTVPLPVLTTSSNVSFANQAIGITGPAQNITIYNNNLIPVAITAITLEQSGDFQFGENNCGLLMAHSNCTVAITFTPQQAGVRTATLKIYGSGANLPHSVSLTGQGNASALKFIPTTPCRVVDTRNAAGPFGGPKMTGGSSRDFEIRASSCNIPSTALAYSLNVTVVPDTQLGYLAIWPAGQTRPVVSTLNSDGRTKANAAIVAAGSNAAISVYVSHASEIILDISGYFVSTQSYSGFLFYPLAPCRVADTRQGASPFGAPYLTAGQTRSFPMTLSTCQIPTTAKAYVVNMTTVPHGPLWFLTAFPAGQTRPLVSTLNAPTGTVTANAAIVPAGTGGSISVYASNDTDLIIDVTGYFAPPAKGGLSFYPTPPCRPLDTRAWGGHRRLC
jgi:sugar lactone lactonase YvrE